MTEDIVQTDSLSDRKSPFPECLYKSDSFSHISLAERSVVQCSPDGSHAWVREKPIV